MTSEMASALCRDGRSMSRCSRDAARTALEHLGKVFDETVVALRPGARSYLASPGPVPVHTDHPRARYVAWWCDRQDALDGASLLVDTRELLGRLPDGGAALERVMLHVVGERAGRAQWVPAFSNGAVFHAPWCEPKFTDDDALQPFDEFLTMIDAGVGRTSVRLHPGDLLVVDNQRMLHGRDAITPGSSRRLIRWWVE